MIPMGGSKVPALNCSKKLNYLWIRLISCWIAARSED